MGFSKEWNDIYIKNEHMSIWPWSDLISYVRRYVDIGTRPIKVLELGCGAGANIPFFQSLNVDYYGIDGSEHIVSQLQKQFPAYSKTIKCADFTQVIPFDTKFDLIVDRGAITHNTTNAIKNCIKLLSDSLIFGGTFIGIDWFSTSHSNYAIGEIVNNDVYTRNNFKIGQFKNCGSVHFSDYAHLTELFSSKFLIKKLEHKVVTSYPEQDEFIASWNIFARCVNND